MTFPAAVAACNGRGIRHDSWVPGVWVRWGAIGWERKSTSRPWEPLPKFCFDVGHIMSLPILIAQGWSVEP